MGVGALTRMVLLDRDGVVNRMWYDPEHGTVDSPARPDQFELLPGVGAAVARLNAAGFTVAVVSNQPGIAKGKLVPRLLDEITGRMRDQLAQAGARLDAVYYCLHHPDASVAEYRAVCECRKPKAGLLRRASEELRLPLATAYMVGDGVTDVQAGRRAGCRTIWVGAMKCDVCRIMQDADATPDLVAADLPAAVDLILAERT